MGPRTTRPRRRLTGGATVATLALLLAVLAPAAALAQDAPCEPVLVTHTPEASTGNTAAVAITAQAIDREVDGWVNVAWQAAEGTELTAITATDLDGTTRTLAEASAAGSAVDVLALRFCGTTSVEAPADDDADAGDADGDADGDEDAAPDDDTDGDDTTEDDEGGQDADTSQNGDADSSGGSGSTGTTSGGSSSGGSSSSDAASAASDDTDDDATSTQEEHDSPEEAVKEEDAAPADDADDADDTDDTDTATDRDDGDAATTADTDADAEVLGVQLARDDVGIAGLRTPLLVILGSLILLGTGGAIWWNRRTVT